MSSVWNIHPRTQINRSPRIVPYKHIHEPFETMECEECGKKLRQISWNHLRMHNMTTDQYKIKYKLPFGEGLTSGQTKAKKRTNQTRFIHEGRIHLIQAGMPGFSGGYNPRCRKSPAAGVKQSMIMKQRYREDPQKFERCLVKGRTIEAGGALRPCFICSYYKRIQIEKLIRQGIPDSKVASYTPVTRTAIQRHRVKCMGLKVSNGRRRISQYRERECLVCGKHFGYYHYPYHKYERKVCGNKCKGKLMSIKNLCKLQTGYY